MSPNRSAVVAVLVLVVITISGAWGWRGGLANRQCRELVRLAPGLDPELARELTHDTDREWLEACRRLGTRGLEDALQTLVTDLETDSFAEFARRRRPLEQAIARITSGLAGVYDIPLQERLARHDASLTPEADFEQHRLETRYGKLAADDRLSSGERIRLLDGLAGRFLRDGSPDRSLNASLVAMQLELQRGRRDLYRARLDSALAMARRIQDYYVECQLLGTLGEEYRSAANEDSMRACFDRGIALALRHGYIDQAARLMKFHAMFYAGQGRLAMAVDRLREARRLCDGPGGEGARVRLQLGTATFFAEMGCWDLLERSLRPLPPLLRAIPRVGRPADLEKMRFDSDCLAARLAFATGQPEDGSRRMQRLIVNLPVADRRVALARLLELWSAGLEATGSNREALEICEHGLTQCETGHVPEYQPALLLRRARLLAGLGRIADAAEALDRARARVATTTDADGRLHREIGMIRADLEFRNGHRREARRLIEQVYRDFRTRLRHGEGGQLSYLALDEARSLRAAIHRVERFAPAAGYRFELAWRSLGEELGGAPPIPTSGSATGASARFVRPLPADEVHLVYWFHDDALVRWTADATGVVCDTLPFSAERGLGEIRDAIEQLQHEPAPEGEVLGPRSLAALRELATVLLPVRVRTGPTRFTRVDVSADGPLLALPFEALPILGPGGEQPLARTADVAYVRSGARALPLKRGSVLVISNPRIPQELAHRYGLAGSLPASEDEVRGIRERWPEARVLAGEQATKDRFLASAPGASLLYLAAHHVRDPEAPFLGFVPLAVPQGASPDAGVLEIADIHKLDLTACRLAVLASCSSGTPDRVTLRPGPSLGDAFLDSGAHAVVASFWDVGDTEARNYLRVFLDEWRDDEASPVAALGRARRRMMATASGRSPRVWAAWSAQTMLR